MAKAILPQAGIYRITHIASGLVYVGSSQHIRKRWAAHRSGLRKGSHGSPRLQNSWAKHGEDAFRFEAVEAVANLSALIEREQHWIDALGAADPKTGFNTSPVAGVRRGVPMPAGQSERISRMHKGKPKSAEQRARMSASATGRKFDAATIEKRSAARRGRKASAATVALLSSQRAGVPQRRKRAITFADAEEIRRLHATGVTPAELGRRYGLTRNPIRLMLDRKTYTEP